MAQPLLAVQFCSSADVVGGTFELRSSAGGLLTDLALNRFRMITFEEANNKSLRMTLLIRKVNWKPSPPTPDALDQAKLAENNRDIAIPLAEGVAQLNPLESHPYTNDTNNCPGMILLHKKVGGGGRWRTYRAILSIRVPTDCSQPAANWTQMLGWETGRMNKGYTSGLLADPSEEEHS